MKRGQYLRTLDEGELERERSRIDTQLAGKATLVSRLRRAVLALEQEIDALSEEGDAVGEEMLRRLTP